MTELLTGWANSAPPDDFWQVAGFLVLLTVGGFTGAFYYLIRKRIMQDIPTSKVRSAAQGYIELSGRSELIEGDSIRAPLTNTTCTWFTYSIEEYTRSGKQSSWVTIENGTSDALFLLIDETGQAVIDPDGARVTPATVDTWYGHSRTPTNLPSGGKLNRLFHSVAGRYRYTEKRIHAGDQLYALGMFNTTSKNTDINVINQEVRELLKEWKQNSEFLLKEFDANQDKNLDMEEWNKVRESALQQVKAQHAEMQKLPSVNMMIKTGDMRRPYLLSAIPENLLVKKYNTYASLCITVFFIAGILATWLINIRLSG